MPKYYKSSDFLKRVVVSRTETIREAKEKISKEEESLKLVGKKLLSQFKDFVNKNPELYDSDFLTHVNAKLTIVSVMDAPEKKAIRVETVYAGTKTVFVLIPYMLITNEDAYKAKRVAVHRFGKNPTISDVKKHYDGKIKKLLEEAKTLAGERSCINQAMGFEDTKVPKDPFWS